MSIRASNQTLFIGRFFIGFNPGARFRTDDGWWEIQGPSLYVGAFPK